MLLSLFGALPRWGCGADFIAPVREMMSRADASRLLLEFVIAFRYNVNPSAPDFRGQLEFAANSRLLGESVRRSSDELFFLVLVTDVALLKPSAAGLEG